MKKHYKRMILPGLIFILILQMTACGKKFDASGYVKSALDANYHQQYSEYAKFVNEDEKELKAEIENSIKENLKQQLADYSQLEESDYETYYTAVQEVYAKTKYNVKETKEADDGFIVEVEVSPINTMETFTNGLEAKLTETYANENTETVPSDKELVAFMSAYMRECNASASYGEPTTVNVDVKKNKDGVYEIPEKGLNELENTMITGEF